MDSSPRKWKNYLLIQPSLMILLFAQSMSGNIFTDLIINRTCKMLLGINTTECDILRVNGSSKEAVRINSLVQPEVSLIIISKSFIESILPAFLSLSLGPWSDKYGRKPLIIAGYVGSAITYVLLYIMTIQDVQPWYFLLASIPSTCVGGICILFLASFCYISDITDNNNRAWMLAWLEILISLGLVMGMFVGPMILNEYGYSAVFGTSFICIVVAGLHVLYFVPETIQSTHPATWTTLFDINNIKELISTCIKKRHGFDRYAVWCCIVCLTLSTVTMQGDIAIGYLFASARLGWNVKQYSDFSAINITLVIVGTLFGIKIIGAYIGLPETFLAIGSVISSLIGASVRTFTLQSWHMYLAVAVGMLGGTTSPVIRAILSKSVPLHDTGKVFSLTTSIETIVPFGATFLYSTVYTDYMPPIYPSPVWLISVILFIVMILVLISIQVHITRSNNAEYGLLSQNSE